MLGSRQHGGDHDEGGRFRRNPLGEVDSRHWMGRYKTGRKEVDQRYGELAYRDKRQNARDPEQGVGMP